MSLRQIARSQPPPGRPIYDEIATNYRESKQLPFRRYIEEFTLFQLLGPLGGKAVLDVACGDGIYSRKLMQHGARSVLGIDVSSRMIALALEVERASPSGISFAVKDAGELGTVGAFDLVLGSYWLNYARSADELERFCRGAFCNLRPGGRFVGFNDNPANAIGRFGSYRKYGFVKSACPPLREGSPITYTFFNPGGNVFRFDNYFLPPVTYDEVFRAAGFRDFRWLPPSISEAGMASAEPGYWDAFFDDPPLIGFEALR